GETIRLLEELKTAQHETNNHLATAYALLCEDKKEEAKDLLSDLCARPMPEPDRVNSGNSYVNAVLNQRLQQARAMGVPYSVDACLSERLPIAPSDLCSLLGNLLSNALEASVDAPEPFLSVTVKPVKGYLMINVRNAAGCDVMKENPDLATTKHDSDKHGFGIKIIRNIAGKYDGMTDFYMEGSIFTAQAMLKINKLKQ
ncbi:MAG: ATP-binding protein, partial [Oscillospiraceae bacterium]|nr:ATP-binding protein [Oscillospiraceae bacterium]